VPGDIFGPLCSWGGGYKYEDLALQVGGVSRIGAIESRGVQTRAGLRLREPAATIVREGATK
jgi:hypothetical protein